jgi:DNA-binding response OmpR family regulator
MARILSVGPSIKDLAARNRALTQCGHQVRGADTRLKALAFAKSVSFDYIVLSDEFFPDSATELADELRASAPGTPILILKNQEKNVSTEEIEALLRASKVGSTAA